jgi:hypothetical protein
VADSRKQYYFITTDKQKASSKDVEEELIQYALEFKINQKYDEETYSL